MQLGLPGTPLQVARDVWVEDGFVGFWRGNVAGCMRIFPTKGILFASQDVYKDFFVKLLSGSPYPSLRARAGDTGVISLLTGGAAGLTTVVLLYPLDLVRARLGGTSKASRYNGVMQTLRLTFREEGIRGLYRGMGPTLLGTPTYTGLKFAVFDMLMSRHEGSLEEVSIGSKALYGGMAGFTASLIQYPNDTVRRRLQMQGMDGAPMIYKHAIDCWRQIYRKEGIGSFYRGLSPALLRTIPSTAIQFTSYNILKHLFLPQKPSEDLALS